MILWTSKPSRDVRAGVTSVIGYRWAVKVSRNEVGLYHQCQSPDGSWYDGGSYYFALIDGDWEVARRHDYYDGPHDQLSLGFLHLCWSGPWCKRCYEGDE